MNLLLSLAAGLVRRFYIDALGKQCTCGHTSCFMQISALLTFCKILLGNIPNPLTISKKLATLHLEK